MRNSWTQAGKNWAENWVETRTSATDQDNQEVKILREVIWGDNQELGPGEAKKVLHNQTGSKAKAQNLNDESKNKTNTLRPPGLTESSCCDA